MPLPNLQDYLVLKVLRADLDLNQYECVPKTWILCHDHEKNSVTVCYPPEKNIEVLRHPADESWPIIYGLIVFDTDSDSEAIKYMNENNYKYLQEKTNAESVNKELQRKDMSPSVAKAPVQESTSRTFEDGPVAASTPKAIDEPNKNIQSDLEKLQSDAYASKKRKCMEEVVNEIVKKRQVETIKLVCSKIANNLRTSETQTSDDDNSNRISGSSRTTCDQIDKIDAATKTSARIDIPSPDKLLEKQSDGSSGCYYEYFIDNSKSHDGFANVVQQNSAFQAIPSTSKGLDQLLALKNTNDPNKNKTDVAERKHTQASVENLVTNKVIDPNINLDDLNKSLQKLYTLKNTFNQELVKIADDFESLLTVIHANVQFTEASQQTDDLEMIPQSKRSRTGKHDLNTKWTLRYPDPGPNLIELIPNTKVYVNKQRLELIQRISCDDSKKLAILLLEEVFSDEALEKCTYGWSEQKPRENGKVVARLPKVRNRPGLDQNAKNTLVTYVLYYSRKEKWPEHSKYNIIKSLRNRLCPRTIEKYRLKDKFGGPKHD